MVDLQRLDPKFRPANAGRLVVVASMVFVLSLSGCSSMKTPAGTQEANFFQNPDRVWAAIQMSLDTLEYEIESSNRPDGKMRAVPIDDDAPSVVFEISQVAWTQDQVRVYVKPVAGDSGPLVGQDVLDVAAADFLTVLKRKLAG